MMDKHAILRPIPAQQSVPRCLADFRSMISSFAPRRITGRSRRLPAAGLLVSGLHAEDLAVARLDFLALRLHGGRIGLEQFQGGERDVLALLLHLGVERAMRKDVNQNLLGLGAEK